MPVGINQYCDGTTYVSGSTTYWCQTGLGLTCTTNNVRSQSSCQCATNYYWDGDSCGIFENKLFYMFLFYSFNSSFK